MASYNRGEKISSLYYLSTCNMEIDAMDYVISLKQLFVLVSDYMPIKKKTMSNFLLI